MKKVVGVALLLVVAVFLLPFLIHRGMEQEQAATPPPRRRSPCPTAATPCASWAATARSPRWT